MKTRVVHIITKLELGGAQETALYMVEHLDRALYDVTLITGNTGLMTPDARAIKDLDFIEVPELVREISPLKDFLALVQLYGILHRLVRSSPGGVLVHTHSSKAGILGRLAARLAGASVIVHMVHGFGFNDDQGGLRHGLFVGLEKLVSGCTDMFIPVAGDNIAKGARAGIFTADRAVVIRSGIDTGFFGTPPADLEAIRAELGLPPGAPVALMVACLKPQKAPLDYVRVASEVLKSIPDAYFLLAGDGELRGEMEAEAVRLGITDRFRLLGWRRDVKDLIHISDVLVLTSLWEGLPRVLPQAMSAGRPIVATAIDGTPEAVKDGVNGFLARPHDVRLMAEKVALLLTDKTLASRMGAAGRDMAAKFDESEMMRRLEALYARLLNTKRGSQR